MGQSDEADPRVDGDRVHFGDITVVGVDVGPETRCAHYESARDVLAIAYPCCETFYPCHRCHEAVADHAATVWPRGDRDVRAILCGSCGRRSSIAAYLDDPERCPACGTGFNPGCRDHHDRYFEVS